jgi:PadR family transcriptional regulator, regulatory protein AphA
MSLSYVLLGLLDKGPLNGYAIKAIFDGSIAFVWQAELSQIYRELEALEKKGFLASSIEMQQDRPNKRVYRITEPGRTRFREWLSEVPETFAMPKRDEFMLRLLFGSTAGEEVVKEEFRRFIAQSRATAAAIARASRGAEGGATGASEGEYYRFLWKRAAMTSEMVIRWAEECLEELEGGSGGRG